MPTPYAVVVAVVRVGTNTGALMLPGLLISGVGAAIFGVVGLVLGIIHAAAVITTTSYDHDGHGVWLFVVDHTWSLPNTVVGSLFLALNMLLGNRLDKTNSRHRSTLVLKKGVFPNFATTIGNVEAGSFEHNITAHEYTHAFQARAFGPLYIPLVVVNYVAATILPYWLLYHDHDTKPIRSLGNYFMCGVYPHTWHEEWAYAVEGSPPCRKPDV